jgi:oligoendopeptidase F
MATEAPTSREIDAFRDDADRFIAELDEEYYEHYAGLKESFELQPIYERHASLTKLETARSLEGAPTELWRFACEGFLGNLTREHQERIAHVEAELEATIDAETVPYRMLRVALANEVDRERRQRLEQTRVRLLDEHLNPVYLEAARIDHEAVQQLGAPNYYELYKRFGFRLDELAEQCAELLDSTERRWEQVGDKLFRERLGIGLADARTWDVPRLFRAPEWDESFPADRMVPALEATLRDLGIDLRGQENVHLDLEVRPKKTPRAFCAPIEVPGRVMLVIQPIGGRDDWEALFHEAGHTEHYANTSAELPMEARRLGDMAVTEGWAMLFQGLVSEPAWLNRRLDVPRVAQLANEGAASLLYFVRRYSAKLLYEIEFFQADDPATMKPRYAELLTEALKIPANPESYLDDIDGSFYVTGYLRSWAFEAQLRDFLRG